MELPASSKPTARSEASITMTSHLAARSVPQLPSLLGASQSFFRTDSLDTTQHQNHRPQGQLKRPKRPSRANSEWLHSMGLALSVSAAESKGQSWLATRSSSTSLRDTDDHHDTASAQPSSPWDSNHHLSSHTHTFPNSPIVPGIHACPGRFSRQGSARHSCRGSQVGLSMTYVASDPSLLPSGTRTPHRHHNARGIEDMTFLIPDFVDPEDVDAAVRCNSTDSEDEAEARKDVFHRGQDAKEGHGLGGLIDSIFDLVLFKVGEDEDELTEEPETAAPATSDRRRTRPRRRESERVIGNVEDIVDVPQLREGDNEGGWKDAAWLLSVASKIIL